jgi:phosphoribosyl-ATP pyrophosphohydrolase
VAPIPISEIFALLDGMRLRDLELRETALLFTQELDSVYRKVIEEKQDAASKAKNKDKPQGGSR